MKKFTLVTMISAILAMLAVLSMTIMALTQTSQHASSDRIFLSCNAISSHSNDSSCNQDLQNAMPPTRLAGERDDSIVHGVRQSPHSKYFILI